MPGVLHLDAPITTERRDRLEALLGEAGDAAEVFVAGDGTLEFRGTLALRANGDRHADVQQFLDEHARVFGLDDRDVGLRLLDAARSDDDAERFVYEQTWRDVPYYQCGVSVEVLGELVRRVVVRLSTNRPASTDPRVTRAEADAGVSERYKLEQHPEPRVTIVDPYLVSGDGGEARPAWRYQFVGPESTTAVLVDGVGPDGVYTTPGGLGGIDIVPLPQYHLSDVTGVPDFVTFAPWGLRLPEVSSGDPVSVALAFFTRLPLMFGTGDVASQLIVSKVDTDDGPTPGRHVVLRQTYAGIPVFGCELRVHLTDSLTIRSVSGNYLRDPAIDVVPRVTETAARGTAATAMAAVRLATTSPTTRPLRRPKDLARILERFKKFFPDGEEAFPGARRELEPREVEAFDKARADALDGAELVVLPGDFPDVTFGTRLAWRVRFIEADIFVDAHAGDPVFAIANMHSARQVLDAFGTAPISLSIPTIVLDDGRSVGTPAATNTEIPAADAAAAGAFGFWGTVGRIGWDGANGNTELVTNALFPSPNASWVMVRDQMWFAPTMVRPDVVGHEFTHGVIQSSSNLLYVDESGAVNEHYADVMGNLAFPDTPSTEWFVGETATGGAGALRDMTAPTVANYAAYSRRGTGCTGVFDPITNTTCDSGGVHTNSGIGNRAAVLLADGDGTPQHPGIGRSRLGRLFADTLTTRLHPWATFLDELHNTWEVARDLQLRAVQPAALPATTGQAPPFDQMTVDEVVWAFTQVGVDRRLNSGWFSVSGGPLLGSFGGRGDTVFNAGLSLPAGHVVADVELVVRAVGPQGQRYWEGRTTINTTGNAVTFPGGVFGARIDKHGIGTASQEVTVHWFHQGFLPLEINVYTVPALAATPATPAVLPTVIEAVSAPQVFWGAFGGKGPSSVNVGAKVSGAGCTITDVFLELMDHTYTVRSTHRMGGIDATYGGTGARIIGQRLNTSDMQVDVHSWFDMGWACRYRIRYQISGTSCSV